MLRTQNTIDEIVKGVRSRGRRVLEKVSRRVDPARSLPLPPVLYCWQPAKGCALTGGLLKMSRTISGTEWVSPTRLSVRSITMPAIVTTSTSNAPGRSRDLHPTGRDFSLPYFSKCVP